MYKDVFNKKFTIGICRGIACQVKGAEKIYEYIVENIGNTSGKIIPVRCLGDCGNAPIVVYNCKNLKKQSLDDVKKLLLNGLKEEETIK